MNPSQTLDSDSLKDAFNDRERLVYDGFRIRQDQERFLERQGNKSQAVRTALDLLKDQMDGGTQ